MDSHILEIISMPKTVSMTAQDTEPRESLMIFLEPAEGDATAVVIPPISVTTINIIEDPSDGTFCSNYLIQ